MKVKVGYYRDYNDTYEEADLEIPTVFEILFIKSLYDYTNEEWTKLWKFKDYMNNHIEGYDIDIIEIIKD